MHENLLSLHYQTQKTPLYNLYDHLSCHPVWQTIHQILLQASYGGLEMILNLVKLNQEDPHLQFLVNIHLQEVTVC